MSELKRNIKKFLISSSGRIISSRTSERWLKKNNPDLLKNIINNSSSHCISISERIHFILNDLTELPKCPVCNSFCHYDSTIPGFKKYCSKNCSQKDLNRIEKGKEAIKKKYGVDNVFELDDVKEKIKKTNLERYGCDIPIKNKEIYNKIKKTNLERYGTDHFNKRDDYKENLRLKQKNLDQQKILEKRKQTNIERYGIDNCSHRDLSEDAKQLSKNKDKLIELHHNKDLSVRSISELYGVYRGTIIDWLRNHDIEIKSIKPQSDDEIQIVDFIKGLGFEVETCNRTVLNGFEIDIFIPDKRIGIEYNGLYWHSDNFKSSNYHKNKTEKCIESDIKLIQIFEDEWIYKQNLVKNKIKHLLGCNKDKIYARKCTVFIPSSQEKKNFYINNHIQGDVNTSINIGLRYGDEMVSCISFNKHKEGYDLVRYATSINVIGGFSKLLKHFTENYEWDKIITFADRRWSEGKLYFDTGFRFEHFTKPNYFYVKGDIRESRIKYQKHKLKNLLKTFDPSLSEYENMKNNGYKRIYDCGHIKFILEK